MVKARTLFEYQLEIAQSSIAYKRVKYQWKFHDPGTESMGKPWKNHGKSMGKIPWIPLKTMEHGAGAKFHGFHGEIPMLSMLAWDSKNCKITPHESMESME